MVVKTNIILAATALCAGAAPAAGAEKAQASQLRAVLACRATSDPDERLTCYDAAVAAFADAEKTGKVVVADEAQIRESRKALFGFGSVRVPILAEDRGSQPTQIEAKIAAIRSAGFQKWELTLDNGMRWRQTDDVQIFPKVDQSVTIRVAALGSYLMKLPSGTIRVIRTQ